MSRAQTNANLLFCADRLTDAQLEDLERCARTLLAAKTGKGGPMSALQIVSADRDHWKALALKGQQEK